MLSAPGAAVLPSRPSARSKGKRPPPHSRQRQCPRLTPACPRRAGSVFPIRPCRSIRRPQSGQDGAGSSASSASSRAAQPRAPEPSMPSRTVVSSASRSGTRPPPGSALIRGSERPNAASAAASSAPISGAPAREGSSTSRQRTRPPSRQYSVQTPPALRITGGCSAASSSVKLRICATVFGWRNSESFVLPAMMFSAARARMRGARRSRVFGSRAGTDPSRPAEARLQPPPARRSRPTPGQRNRLNPKIWTAPNEAKSKLIGWTEWSCATLATGTWSTRRGRIEQGPFLS